MDKKGIKIAKEKVGGFCRKWKIAEFSLFGSILTEHFGPESDVDVLVSFAQDADWSLFDLAVMEQELEEIFGREVDLVEKEFIRNPFRRHSILSSKEVIYESR
jgi:uncharacterized protein